MTEDVSVKPYQDVLGRMVLAHWVYAYSSAGGRISQITWTEHGAECVAKLRDIILTSHLNKDPEAPVLFDKAAHGEALPSTAPFVKPKHGRRTFRFWRESLQDIRLPRDKDSLMVFVSVVCNYGPASGVEFLAL